MKLPLGRIRDSCDPGSFSLSPSSTTQDALMSLFTHILKIFKHRKIFEDAPSFFVVYAWDQPSHPDLPADSSIVQEMIRWFEDAGYSTMYSDSTPPSEKAVIDGQLRLLPIAAHPDSVQNVILCGSKLLGHYMAGRSFKKYVSDMKSSYRKSRIEGRAAMSQTVRIVQRRHYERAIKNEFHHVMTELALLKIRERYNEKSTIIPYLLNGDPQSCLPKYITNGSDNLRVQLGVDGSRAASELSYMNRVPEGFLEKYQSKANKASDDFSSAQRQNPKGIGVSAVREALDAYHSEITSIERVFGETLPLRKHHIDLTVVEHFDPKKEGKKSYGPVYVTIDSLFDERELKGGNSGQPTRILIHGRPGIGKTTLCKQILDEYGRQEVRGALFSWVLWVPLRKLGLDDSLKSFFRSEYFHGKLYEELLAEKLYQQVFGEDKEKTLLILDGLDESSGWEVRNIREIAQFKTIVFTTRSGRGRAGSAVYTIVDLELEAMGFNKEVAYDYIESQTAVQSEETAIDIESFIERSPVFQLAQTPICLDILCSSWDDLLQAMPSDGMTPLTVLYEVVVARLWRRDILRLRKCDPLTGSVITKDILDAVRDFRRLYRVITVEMTFLETLAITLTTRGKIEFGDDEIIGTIHQVERDTMLLPLSLEYDLRNLSFLHSDGYGGYSFIHLTFQEYFAASWLLRNVPSLRVYMAKWKYHPHFERIWQFIAGFLRNEETLLPEYFELIESEPLDLLGPAHQRLLMRCFDEVRHSLQPPIRTKILHRMALWLEFECEISLGSFLENSPEYPYELMHIFLGKSAPMCAREVLNNSWMDIFLPPSILKHLITMVNVIKKYHLFGLCRALDAHEQGFLGATLAGCSTLLNDRNEAITVRIAAADMLSMEENLSDEIVKSLAEMLQDTNKSVRDSAAHAMRRQSSFSVDTIEILMTILKDDDEDARQAAALAFSDYSELPRPDIGALEALVCNSNASIQSTAAVVLAGQQNISDDGIAALVSLHKHHNEEIRASCARALNKYMERVLGGLLRPSEAVEAALIMLLEDPHITEDCRGPQVQTFG
ncbi:hypothetical protein MHUMG1_05804 [Metarhizium humberi]|uniref:NACHT domain-containing protein n=1 Tax=Metarhizium humberi TaxID=2596975 RepID=A0A9P8M9N9_9HYPO|nr:hypothetical protein MHUMG1_05804 [Metarhizium humberi]